MKTAVREVRHSDEFVVRAGEREFRAPVLVVATGGLSIPKIGATDLGYRLARQFGLAIRETRPGLVPVTFNEADRGRTRIWRESPPKLSPHTMASASGKRC